MLLKLNALVANGTKGGRQKWKPELFLTMASPENFLIVFRKPITRASTSLTLLGLECHVQLSLKLVSEPTARVSHRKGHLSGLGRPP